MSYKAGNRFKEDTYFLTEVENDGSKARVTGQLNGEEVDFESGGSGGSGVLRVIYLDGEFSETGDAYCNPSPADIRTAYDNGTFLEVCYLLNVSNSYEIYYPIKITPDSIFIGMDQTNIKGEINSNIEYDPALELPF